MAEVLEQKQEAEVKTETQAAVQPVKEEAKPADKHDELPKGVQRTINRLTRQRGEIMEVVQQQQQRIEELESRINTGARPVAIPDENEPKLEDFETWDEYHKVSTKYIAERAVKMQLKAEQEAADKLESDSLAREKMVAYQQRLEEARERYPDWEEAKSEFPNVFPKEVGQALEIALVEHEGGPDILYFLAKNPEVCESLAKMTPMRAVTELGRIGYELSKEKPAKITSKAAAPVSPVVAGSATSTKPLGKMSMPEFIAVRNAQRKALGKKIY